MAEEQVVLAERRGAVLLVTLQRRHPRVQPKRPPRYAPADPAAADLDALGAEPAGAAPAPSTDPAAPDRAAAHPVAVAHPSEVLP